MRRNRVRTSSGSNSRRSRSARTSRCSGRRGYTLTTSPWPKPESARRAATTRYAAKACASATTVATWCRPRTRRGSHFQRAGSSRWYSMSRMTPTLTLRGRWRLRSRATEGCLSKYKRPSDRPAKHGSLGERSDPLDNPEHRNRTDRVGQGVTCPRRSRQREARDQRSGGEREADEEELADLHSHLEHE